MTAVASKEVTVRQIAAVRFGFYSDEEVLKLSVKQIHQPLLVDSLRNPIPGGLYDPALGPIDRHGRCSTCTLNSNDCPGHFGHINLPVPVYNPLIFNMMYRLLRQQCHSCFHLRLDREEVSRFEAKLALLASGRLTDAVALQVSKSTLPRDLAEIVEDISKGKDVHKVLDQWGVQPSAGKLTSLTLEAIQDTISELFARIPAGRCRNCEAHSPSVKKQGASRLFKVWTSAKSLASNARMGKVVRSVIATNEKTVASLEDDMAKQLAAERVKRAKHAKDRKRDKKGEDGDVKGLMKEDGDVDDSDDDDEVEIIEEKLLGRDETLEDLEAENEAARAIGSPDDMKMDVTNLKEQMKPRYMTAWEANEMLKRLWEREWRLLTLVFGPGSDMWGATASAGRAGGKALMKGISLTMKAGQVAVQFSPAAEEAAKKAYRMFFVRVLPVAPNKFRPPSVMGDQMFEHPQNTCLQRILTICLELQSISETMANQKNLTGNVLNPQEIQQQELSRMISQWLALQDAVSGLMDSTMAENQPEGIQGIRQALEKKEGLFRKNMMGKRVNFAARSVISPDPYIGTGEIGVPPYFAMRLCFPERVTPWNIERLRQAVIRGPHQLNGAVAIEDGRGRIINLKTMDEQKRMGIAKMLLSNTEGGGSAGGVMGSVKGSLAGALPSSGSSGYTGSNKIVYRHLQDGDLMLTNRQPTLHKPSLMAHRARVLKGEKTIRFHYANCSTFNADFDGDEINLHLPQDQFGRAEGYGIVHADHQYIVPTDGKPVRGLIQDHVVSGVLLTKRDTWLTKAEYSQLVFLACHAWRRAGAAAEGPEFLELEPPAILKPRPLWSGKQVVSTVVRFYTWGKPPLTFTAGGKVPADYWGKTNNEHEMVFQKGYFIAGCVDKNVFGKFGLVHAIQEMYGGPTAGALLSSFSRLFTAYLQYHGFTCGFDDLLLNQNTEDKRKTILAKAEAIAVRASAEFVGMPLPVSWQNEPTKHEVDVNRSHIQVRAALSERYRATRSTGAAHDMKGSGVMHPLSSEVVKACLPSGQIKPFPGNCLSLMTVSGAKGSLVNFSQISCLLGQQELEGRRVPRMASGSTLPCFAPYDGGARSCGFVGDRFLSGLRPQEYYFHCMAGREGLIDTTVKTSRSGYLQRCLVKNLETLRVHYDYTVRDNADGSIVQFYYGDDGLDVLSVSYMNQLGFLARNADRFKQVVDLDSAVQQSKAGGTRKVEKSVKKQLHARAETLAKIAAASKEGDAKTEKACKAKLTEDLPLLAVQPPSVLGATSEAFLDKLLKYMNDNPDGALSKDSKEGEEQEDGSAGVAKGGVAAETFLDMMCLKYMRALAAPGEAVGVLAAQSIGEPSTQMTLNTFHMAGRGEANVTLGIPRLREILMTAAPHIKTPVMTLPLHKGMGTTDANVLAGRMRRLRLAECLAGIGVEELPVSRGAGEGMDGYGRAYTITLKFFNESQYPQEFGLTFEELVGVFRGMFCNRLRTEVDKEVRKKSGSSIKALIGRVDGSKLGGEENMVNGNTGAADEDGEGEAGGASRARAKRGKGKEDEAEDGQDLPANDEDDEAEVDENMEEGKMRFRGTNDDTTYEAPDEEDQQAAQDAATQAGKRALAATANEDDDDESSDEEEKGGKAKKAASGKGAKKAASAKTRKAEAAAAPPAAERCEMDAGDDDVDFDNHTCRLALHLPLRAPKLLMLEIVERVAANVMVRQTDGIDKVYVLPADQGKDARVQTDGVNFESVWQHADIIDVNGITTNDVAAMLRTYGVEAARATILREVSSVFAAYGIGVDPRHLGLIADFMTQQGGYRACNRIGIESSVSPFLKMSFETAAHFLTDATLRSAKDDLSTPSARLCVGQVVEVGTGVLGVMQDLKAAQRTTKLAA